MRHHLPRVAALRVGLGVLATSALAACSSSESQPSFTDGMKIAVAPLTLPALSGVCYDLRVTNGPDGTGETVWSQGTPGLNGGTPDAGAICSTKYGSGAGADITYIGPCDADGQEDPSDAAGERMNSVTVWFDALYDADGAYMDPAAASGWQNPCPAPEGCTLNTLCSESADALVEFSFTLMREANQGFFDVAVNFEDIFCSAKLDTCYANDQHIELLHGADLARDWTAVFGFACTAGRGDAQTTMHYGELEVVCDDGSTFLIDPTAAPGNNTSTAANANVLRYGIYRGAEGLECDDPTTSGVTESCNKVYWNLAFDLEDLAALGATCTLTFSATATDGGAGFVAGLPASAGVAYPYIDVAATLTSAGVASCQRHALNDGGAVNTAYHGSVGAAGGLAFAPSVMCSQFEGTAAGAVPDAAGCPVFGDACAGQQTVWEGDLVIYNDDDAALYLPQMACIKEITGMVEIWDTTTMTDLSAFARLERVNTVSTEERFLLNGNSALTTASLPRLTSAGGVNMMNNPALTTINLPQLGGLAYDIIVGNNGALTSVSMPLVTGARSAMFYMLPNLTTLDLPVLANIGYDFQLFRLPALSVVNVGALGQVVRDLRVRESGANVSFPDLATVGGLLELSLNPAMTSIALPSLTNAGRFTVSGNVGLQSLSAPALTRVEQGLTVANNGSLTSLDLTALSSTGETTVDFFGANVVFASNGLEAINLPALATVGGYLSVDESTALVSLSATSLVSVGGLSITYNAALTSFQLPALTTVHNSNWGNGFFVTNNDVLSSFDLSNLTFVGQSEVNGAAFHFENNPQTSTCLVDAVVQQLLGAGWTGSSFVGGNLPCP